MQDVGQTLGTITRAKKIALPLRWGLGFRVHSRVSAASVLGPAR